MKSKRLSFTLMTIITFQILSFSQTQLGADIKGETFEDQFGQAMALSDDGTIVAIGAKENDEVASNAGHVRLYKIENGEWTQLGLDIDGTGPSDRLGTSIALSANGLVVACGAPENGSPKGYVVLREWDGNAWLPKGEIIEGIGVGERFGIAVSLSADGSRLAVGAIHNDEAGNNAGQVRIYDWDGNAWNQIGPSINGTAAGDNSGSAVALSADGHRVAIGAIDNDETGTSAGQVRVFEWAADSTWQQIGTDIYGEDTRDESGTTVQLSTDGNRLAISAPFNDGNGNWSGHVRVFEWREGSWTQMGDDLDGEDEFDRSGWSMDMGANGNRIIIGAVNNGGNGTQAGHARVYEWSGNEWKQVGKDIDGDMRQDLLGYSVALSENGQIVGVGAPINGNSFESNAGYARVFTLEEGISTSIQSVDKQELIHVYPNPVENVLNIDLKLSSITPINLEVQNLNGQQFLQQEIRTNQRIQLDISDLPKGFFTLTIKGETINKFLKFVKQ